MMKLTDQFAGCEDFRRIAQRHNITEPDTHAGVQMALLLREKFSKLNASDKSLSLKEFFNVYFYENNQENNGELINAIIAKKMNEQDIKICLEMIIGYLTIATNYFPLLRQAKYEPYSRYNSDTYENLLAIEAENYYSMDYRHIYQKANIDKYIDAQAQEVNHLSTDFIIDSSNSPTQDLHAMISDAKGISLDKIGDVLIPEPVVCFDDLLGEVRLHDSLEDLSINLSQSDINEHEQSIQSIEGNIETKEFEFKNTYSPNFISEIYRAEFIDKINIIDSKFFMHFGSQNQVYLEYEGREIFVSQQSWVDCSEAHSAQGFGALSLYHHLMFDNIYQPGTIDYQRTMNRCAQELGIILNIAPEYLPENTVINTPGSISQKIKDMRQDDPETKNSLLKQQP